MTLNEWHLNRRETPLVTSDFSSGSSDITIVTYIYGGEGYVENNFFKVKNSILETWRHLGFLKTVIVTSDKTISLQLFEKDYAEWVRIDVSYGLIPGDLYAYSRDCIKNLYLRFDTPYMLFIHPDGFPLRSGIEKFVGRYDYIGAPWSPADDDWIGKLLLSRKNFVGNGGFSLRSRAICEAAASLYNRGFKYIPNIFLMYEDIFFTRVLTKYIPSYRKRFTIASPEEAREFAIETTPIQDNIVPLGFHSASAFERLMSHSGKYSI